ncbi:MAG: IgA Peptidase M64, partial [Prevotella sp.]|nr:IgA Peptidase M64 [Prevotella sp.]
MKRTLISIIVALVAITATAQNFDEYFTGNTLRLDYVFAGDRKSQAIYVDQLTQTPGWYGRRHNLDRLPLEGNGQITVRDAKTQRVIYRHSFSTLFQEWLATEESKTTPKSFENVFLVPFPKDSANITVELFDYHQKTFASLTHKVRPDDILIRKINRPQNPFSVIHPAKDTTNCINIAFVAEGYTQDEMASYIDDVKIAVDALFSHATFNKYKDYLNIIAVESPSKESGTSEPGNGKWINTALSSHFSTFYSDRYLTTLHLKQLHDQLVAVPYEHIIVLVNSTKYGGGGIYNSYTLTAAKDKSFRPVVVHEFGHSFGGLADEYTYSNDDPMYFPDTEPWEQNIT